MTTFTLYEDGAEFGTVEADSAEEALDSVDLGNGSYDTSDGTVWVTISAEPEICEHPHVTDSACDECGAECSGDIDEIGNCVDCECPLHGDDGSATESGSRKFAVDPKEPDCEDDRRHFWKQESVTLHDGGGFIRDVCPRCNVVRLTDTWAQDPSDGEQGLTSVKYEAPKLTRGDIVERIESLTFYVPPRAQGQMVEYAFACDRDYIYERIHDRSDRSTAVRVYAHPKDASEDWDPWNGEPSTGELIMRVNVE